MLNIYYKENNISMPIAINMIVTFTLPKCLTSFTYIIYEPRFRSRSSKHFSEGFNIIFEASRGAAARSVTVKPTGCGLDPHSRR